MKKFIRNLTLLFIFSGYSLVTVSVSSGNILLTSKKLYSEHDEELIIRDFFNDRKNGFFVDVGCAHYMYASTTYYLERHLGWFGIAIDALDEFGNGFRENRPHTKFFSFIVTDHSGTKEIFYRRQDNVWLSLADEEEKEDFNGKYEEIHVSTITLNELFEAYKILKIDFLSMDIEGSEPAALAGFDINRFKPELVCIEAHFNEAIILDYFKRNNYERIDKYLKYDKQNWYFRPRK